MSVHQKVYNTLDLSEEEAFAVIGGGDIDSIIARRESLRSYLETNKWDVDKYKQYVRESFSLPSKTQMAKNVAQAGKQALMSGFKEVSDEEQQRRHNICKSGCPEYIAEGKYKDRCAKCGCWTTFKSTLKAWHCPIDKW
jgi:hypothetical protein